MGEEDRERVPPLLGEKRVGAENVVFNREAAARRELLVCFEGQ